MLKEFRKYKIRYKIMLPLLTFMILLLIIVLAEAYKTVNKTFSLESKTIIANKIHKINNLSKQISNNALFIASILSKSSLVKGAYENYYKTGNLEESTKNLENQFKNFHSLFTEISNTDLKIHFHLPPAKSFYRNWSDKKGDDISSFRKSVMQISKDYQYKKGIETGLGGFAIRGIAPIFSDSGQYYGSVEVFFNINELIKEEYRGKEDEYAIFIHKDYKKIVANFSDEKLTNITLESEQAGNFFLVEKTDFFNLEKIESIIPAEKIDTNIILIGEKYQYGIVPIKNFLNETEGIIILQLNNQRESSAVYKILLTSSFVFLLIIISVVIILSKISNHYIVSRVKETDDSLKKLSEGQLIEIKDNKYEDEINSMQESLKKLNDTFKKNIDFAESIGKGEFSHKYKAISKSDKLGTALEEMRNKLAIITLELKEQKEIAEESSALKSQFLKNMSHEVRTPLNGIVGFSELLTHKKISDENNREYTKIIVSCSMQLLKIIDDILEISGYSTDKAILILKQTNANKIPERIYEAYKNKITNKDLKLIISRLVEDIIFETDPERAYKIIDIFTHNAIKFSKKGKIEISVSIDDNYVLYEVKDQGIGINKSKLSKIFDDFAQADNETAVKYGGLGLGLSIAKQNARLLNGKIKVSSIENFGSAFSLMLPLDSRKTLDNADLLIIDNIYKQKKGKKSILIAEDEQVNYVYLKTIINDLFPEFIIIHSKNGKEAVEECMINDDICLILLDLKMPIMDGFTAGKIIKKHKPDIPIIVQSAYTTSSEKEKAQKIGCDGYLTKPISESDIENLINKFL